MSQEVLKERLRKLGQLESQLHGERFQVVFDYQTLYTFVQNNPHRAVYVELPWYEEIGEETYTYNQVIVQSMDPEQVCFLNPLPASHPEGGEHGGNGKGPERNILADGSECMDAVLFQRLFRLAGGALIPESP